MADYIERKVAIDALKSVLNDPNCPVFIAATVEQVLTEAPAANMREDVQGEWVPEEDESINKRNRLIRYKVYSCSICGRSNGRVRKKNSAQTAAHEWGFNDAL